MVEVKKAVLHKNAGQPVYVFAAAIALMVAANIAMNLPL